MRAKLMEETELVPEFRIDLGISLVAAGRDIEIVHGDLVSQTGAFSEHHGDVPAIDLAAEILHVDPFERNARDYGDAVIAFLSVESGVFVAETLETLHRESVNRTLGLLQAEHIGLRAFQESRDQINAQPDRVDVPGGDLERHCGNL